MAQFPFFSIITPSYNQARFIRQTIESVLALGLTDFEHIVMDGGSTDGTVELLKEYPHLIWVSEKDKGQSDALNKGIARSHGEVIGWLNSDDFYLPGGGVVQALEYFATHLECGIITGNNVRAREDGSIYERLAPNMSHAGLLAPWRSDSRVNQPGTLFRRIVYDRHGPIDATVHYAMDYKFFLNAGGEFPIHPMPVDIAALRMYGNTKTSQGFDNFARDFQRILREYYAKQNQPLRARYAVARSKLHSAHMLLMESVVAETEGDLTRAMQLRSEAVARNPLVKFSYPYICFRLLRLLGPQRYAKLRRMLGRGGSSS